MSRAIWFHSYTGYKTESNKWTNKQKKWTKPQRQTQYGGNKREEGWRVVKGKGSQIHGDGDLTLGGGHTVQYIDDVSQNSTFETYKIVITNITPKFFKVNSMQ